MNSFCFTLMLAEVSPISNRPEFVSSTKKEFQSLVERGTQNIDSQRMDSLVEASEL